MHIHNGKTHQSLVIHIHHGKTHQSLITHQGTCHWWPCTVVQSVLTPAVDTEKLVAESIAQQQWKQHVHFVKRHKRYHDVTSVVLKRTRGALCAEMRCCCVNVSAALHSFLTFQHNRKLTNNTLDLTYSPSAKSLYNHSKRDFSQQVYKAKIIYSCVQRMKCTVYVVKGVTCRLWSPEAYWYFSATAEKGKKKEKKEKKKSDHEQ